MVNFIDKCPKCHKKRNGKRSHKYHHLILIVCQNPFCSFKTLQIYTINDFIVKINLEKWMRGEGKRAENQ